MHGRGLCVRMLPAHEALRCLYWSTAHAPLLRCAEGWRWACLARHSHDAVSEAAVASLRLSLLIRVHVRWWSLLCIALSQPRAAMTLSLHACSWSHCLAAEGSRLPLVPILPWMPVLPCGLWCLAQAGFSMHGHKSGRAMMPRLLTMRGFLTLSCLAVWLHCAARCSEVLGADVGWALLIWRGQRGVLLTGC